MAESKGLTSCQSFQVHDEVSNFKKLVKKSKEGYIHAFCNLFQGYTVPVQDIQIYHI